MAKEYCYYMYKIDLEFYLPNKDPIKPTMVKIIKKRFDYYNNFYPIFEVECLMDQVHMELIRNSQYAIYCSMKIEGLKYKGGSEEKPTEAELEAYETKSLLDHIFVPFFTKNSFSSLIRDKDTNPEENKAEEDNGYSTNPASALGRTMSFALYSVKGLKINKEILNVVGDKADVGTMIKYLISKIGVEEAIIDMPDNTEKYDDLVVPPKNINLAIKELQARYGIYNSALTVFYDPPCIYVLNKLSNDHDYDKDKINKILFNITVGNLMGSGSLSLIEEKDKTSIDYLISASIFKDNKDVYNSEVYGTELMFSNYTLSSIVATYKEGEADEFTNPVLSIITPNVKHKDTGNKIMVEYDELNNPYNMASVAKMMSMHTIIKLSKLNGVNLESFLPNSIITIKVTDDDKYDEEFSDDYSIISGEMIFKRNSPTDERFLCSVDQLQLTNLAK